MQKLKIFFWALASILIVSVAVLAQETQDDSGYAAGTMTTQEVTSGKSNVEVAPGMGVTKMGAVSIVGPKDIKVQKQEGRVISEDPAAYMGRKFEAIESRLDKIEQQQEELKKELEQLKPKPQNAKPQDNLKEGGAK